VANGVGLTKIIEKGKQKVHEKLEARKQEGQERKKQQVEERKIEHEAYVKERQHQIAERGKHTAQRQYGNGGKKQGKSVKGYVNYAGSVPMFKAVDPMSALIGSGRKPKPKVPSKTTRIVTGGKTITIKENVSPEEQQKKKKPEYDFPDPFADFL
jgi:hypothetical protein